MKFTAMTLSSTLFFSSMAFAAERSIYDLMYLPQAKTSFGFSEIATKKGELKIKSNESEFSTFQVRQTLGHALSDNLAISTQLNYVTQDQESDLKGPDDSEMSGISDPSFKARYRLHDEFFRWDIIGDLRVKTGDRKIDGSDANNKSGSHAVSIGTQFGTLDEYMQWAIDARFTRNLEQTVKYDGDKITNDGRNEYLLGGSLLYKLLDENSFIKSFASLNFQDTSEGFDASMDLLVGVEFQHLFTPDYLFRVGGEYGSQDIDDKTIDSFTTFGIYLAANYQF